MRPLRPGVLIIAVAASAAACATPGKRALDGRPFPVDSSRVVQIGQSAIVGSAALRAGLLPRLEAFTRDSLGFVLRFDVVPAGFAGPVTVHVPRWEAAVRLTGANGGVETIAPVKPLRPRR